MRGPEMGEAMRREPVLLTNLVAAALALAVAFGVPLSEEQHQAVLGVTAAIVAIYLGQAAVARSKVYSPATVERLLDGRAADGGRRAENDGEAA